MSCSIKKNIVHIKGLSGNSLLIFLKRNFHASKPNEKWVTDVTEFHLHGKKTISITHFRLI